MPTIGHLLVEADGPGRPEEAGVAVVEDAAVGRRRPVAAAITGWLWRRSHREAEPRPDLVDDNLDDAALGAFLALPGAVLEPTCNNDPHVTLPRFFGHLR